MKNQHDNNPTESHTISETNLINPAQFTIDVVAALQKAAPGLKIEILCDLELKLHVADGREAVAHLDNPYRAYQARSLERDDIIAQFVSGYIAMSTVNVSERIERAHILPLLKRNAWLLQDSREAEFPGARHAEQVHQRFNDDLVIVYVGDMPKTMIFLSGQSMAALGLDSKALHTLALENLNQQFPGLLMGRKDGVYRVTCGGIYDASLILLDRFFDATRSMVSGDLIVAVPAEDCLLVAGSEDKEVIRKLSELAQEHFTKAMHPLSPKLLVRREGIFLPFGAGR
jgi:uncharacterized protein YtpQ (UPF0354 family)